jgi:hypothetical protein
VLPVNWDAIGSVGEVIGALAVFLTLIYLAIQARQNQALLEENRKIALSQVYMARSLNRIENRRQLADSQYLPSIVQKVRNAPSRIEGVRSLNEEERIRYVAYVETAMLHQDNNLYQHELGLLDPDKYDSAVQVIINQMPMWLELEMGITQRLIDFYDSHRDA